MRGEGSLHTKPFEVCVTPVYGSSGKGRTMSPPAGHVCVLLVQLKSSGIRVKINTITYFHFCSGDAKEDGNHGWMLSAVALFDLKERFDTIIFQTAKFDHFF